MMNDPTDVDPTIGRWLRPTPHRPKTPMLIFIAVPTKGVAYQHGPLAGTLREHFARDVARLHEMYPDHTFVVPMLQDYALLPHMKVEATWEKWGHHCRVLISVCDAVWVIMYDGYETSTGVAAEMEHAHECDKPVTMLHPSMFEGVTQ